MMTETLPITIQNVPDKFESFHNGYVVVTLVDGELWYYGFYEEKDRAQRVYKESDHRMIIYKE